MTPYQSIYRKWRPQFFEDIVGQGHITQTLMNAIKLNRISHAYIFSGPRGVGKTTTARIMAKALNCQKGPTSHPCNQCQQCIRINQGQSMDVMEIDGASNRGIDEIRELRSNIGFSPAEGRYKVYIIDEVHMLTNEAFNALLKTLEEPPSRVLFIFATTEPQKVPKTILSRCQCFYFRRISIDEVVTKLKRIIKKEKLELDDPSLHLIAEAATGSMRDAESILDQVSSFSEKKITYENVKEILGVIPQKLFLQFIQSIAARDVKEGLDLIDFLVRQGVNLQRFVQDLIVYTHRLSVIKILGENGSPGEVLEEEDPQERMVLVKKIEIDRILDIIEELSQIETKMKYHHYPWVLLELALVKLTHCKIEQTNKEVSVSKADPEKMNKKTEQSHPVKAKTKQEVQHEEPKKSKEKKDLIITDTANVQQKCQLDELWPKLLNRIKGEKISLYTFLVANSKISLEDNQLMIGFHQDYLFHKESLEKRENKEIVETILKDEAKLDIRIKCFVDKNAPDGSTPSRLEKNPLKSKSAQPVVRDSVKREEQTGNNQNHSSSAEEILAKAHDLFGGRIRED